MLVCLDLSYKTQKSPYWSLNGASCGSPTAKMKNKFIFHKYFGREIQVALCILYHNQNIMQVYILPPTIKTELLALFLLM